MNLFRFFKTYLITCPDNLEPAAVKLAAVDDRLRACSRWPEMAGCAQDCLTQLESSPHDCQVRTIVARWYENRACCFCGRAIGQVVWHDRPPALRTPDGITREWKEVAPEDLPRLFNDAEPVCWTCHIVESFRRDHLQQVIERVRMPERASTLPPSVNVY